MADPNPQAEAAARAAREQGAKVLSEAQQHAGDVAHDAGDKIIGLAHDAQDRAASVADKAQTRAGDVLAQARDSAVGLASSVQDRLGDGMSTQKDQAADAMGSAAGQAHKAADLLRETDHKWLAGLVGSSADELGAFADMIHANDFNGLLQRVRGLADRQPALFAGASVAVGFALARMARVAMEPPSSGQQGPFMAPIGGRDPRTTPPAATYPGTTDNG
ncbi:MAG: hypothetical protein ABI369_11315 [Acetobacteraceae bacterium]